MQIFTHEGGDDIELGGLLDDLAWEFVGEHHRRQDLIRFRLKDGSRNIFNGKSRFCYDATANPAADDLKKELISYPPGLSGCQYETGTESRDTNNKS